MGKRKRKLRALQVKHKSAALTKTEITRKRINVKTPETTNDIDSAQSRETVLNWLSQLHKKNSVVSRSTLREITKELKTIPVEVLEQHSSSIINAVIPFIIDSEEETRKATLKLLASFLERSSKPEFLPPSFMSFLRVHLYHHGISAFETGSQLVLILKQYRKSYLIENIYELLSLYTRLLEDSNAAQSLPFSVESSEQQFCFAIQLMDSFEALLSTLCESSPKHFEFESLLKNNEGGGKDIHIVVKTLEFSELNHIHTVNSTKDILSSELVKLITFICRTIQSFGKYPIVAVGDKPNQKKLLVIFSRLVSLIGNVIFLFELSNALFKQCKDYLSILMDTLKSFQLKGKELDKFWEESFLRFAEFSCFLCFFLELSLLGSCDCNYSEMIVTKVVDICNDYLNISSDSDKKLAQGYLVILANILFHLMKLLPLHSIIPLLDAFIAHWMEADIHAQCDFSCFILLWEVIRNQDLLCRCEWGEKMFHSFLKIAWNALRNRNMEKYRRVIYFWLAATFYIPEQYHSIFEESCYLAKNFFGKRKKNNDIYSFVPGPFVFLPMEMKRAVLSLLFRSGRFCLETAEVLLVCVQHPNCIADQSSWMVFGFFLELLRRFSISLSYQDRSYIACLVIIVVYRLVSNDPAVKRKATSLGQKCLVECRLDRNSLDQVRHILQSEKQFPIPQWMQPLLE